MARRVVENYWLADAPVRDVNGDLSSFDRHIPAHQRTYRCCTETWWETTKAGTYLVQCAEAALVLWSQRHDPELHQGRCKKHGGPK